MKVAVIDYEAGNIKSVCGIFRLAAAGSSEIEIFSTNKPDRIAYCDKLILPGVGSCLNCYNKLNSIRNMIDAIRYAVTIRKVEFLGICVGMQLLASVCLEDDKKVGFGWLPGVVTKLDSVTARVPHMGWNALKFFKNHHLFSLLPSVDYACKAYFVHSYEYIPTNYDNVLAITMYDKAIVAAACHRNVIGVQFHPEKSHWVGVRFCKNFLSWRAPAAD
ncbi:Imidazole glycerol phosphate synthase subunit HisH 1 [Candidatus Hodgkinia cicadicola]|nr:Imidazole glycerol phosphate synthase subunit HisH 1 [Candidatus Hodgkinia cicadicola]